MFACAVASTTFRATEIWVSDFSASAILRIWELHSHALEPSRDVPYSHAWTRGYSDLQLDINRFGRFRLFGCFEEVWCYDVLGSRVPQWCSCGPWVPSWSGYIVRCQIMRLFGGSSLIHPRSMGLMLWYLLQEFLNTYEPRICFPACTVDGRTVIRRIIKRVYLWDLVADHQLWDTLLIFL